MSAVLVCSKVLSPQYFLFLLPMLVLAPAPRAAGAAARNWCLVLGIYALTGTIFPWLFGDLVALKPLAAGLLAIRNSALGILSFTYFHRAWVTP